MDNIIQVGAGAVIIKDNQTLLAKRSGAHGEHSYGSFGGHVELGETPIQATIREAREKLGIEIGNLQFVSCTSFIKYGQHYIDISFVADLISGTPTIKEIDRVTSVDWYPLDNLPSPLFEPVRIALEAYKTGKRYFEIRE